MSINLKNINSAYIYLPVLLISVSLCLFLHFKIAGLNKKVSDLEATKLQLSLDSIDLILKKENETLSPEEVQLLSEVVVRHHLGDLTYTDFKITHIAENENYVAAKAASILLKQPDLIPNKQAKFEGQSYLIKDIISDAYEKGKDLLK